MKRKNKTINSITVENKVKQTFDGEPVPMDAICEAVDIVSRELGITDMLVTVDDFGLASGRCFSGNHIGIDYCCENIGILETVAHEMRHAYQILNELFDMSDCLTFDYMDDDAFESYENRAYEVDARAFANMIVEKYSA